MIKEMRKISNKQLNLNLKKLEKEKKTKGKVSKSKQIIKIQGE